MKIAAMKIGCARRTLSRKKPKKLCSTPWVEGKGLLSICIESLEGRRFKGPAPSFGFLRGGGPWLLPDRTQLL